MLVVRAINANDLDALYGLASQVGTGMTTLKPDMKMLGDRLAIACASFAETIPPEKRDYMFVMEDTDTGRLAGVCAIKGAVGLEEPFYNYRIGTLVHSSRELDVFTRMETLYLSNDLTGSTELCSLFLHPDWRRDGNGSLLSKSRFLFLAEFPEYFSPRVIAEMRGVSDEHGRSPFWESLGRHFFSMEFSEADYLTGIGNKSFIAELMPQHLIYTAFLSAPARAVIGQVHANTRPALALLTGEGFRYNGYVDIFDAGPAVECPLADIRAVRDSLCLLAADRPPPAHAQPWLVSNRRRHGFAVTLAHTAPDADGQLPLDAQALAALAIAPGDSVRAVPLSRPHPNRP